MLMRTDNNTFIEEREMALQSLLITGAKNDQLQ
jgi:hypothetical protein